MSSRANPIIPTSRIGTFTDRMTTTAYAETNENTLAAPPSQISNAFFDSTVKVQSVGIDASSANISEPAQSIAKSNDETIKYQLDPFLAMMPRPRWRQLRQLWRWQFSLALF